MRSDIARFIVYASLSNSDLFSSYMEAKKQNDPHAKTLGIELVQRMHRKYPMHFTRDILEKTIKTLEERYP